MSIEIINNDTEKKIALALYETLSSELMRIKSKLIEYDIKSNISKYYCNARPMVDIIELANSRRYVLLPLEEQILLNMKDNKTYISDMLSIYGYRVRKDKSVGSRVEQLYHYANKNRIIGEIKDNTAYIKVVE